MPKELRGGDNEQRETPTKEDRTGHWEELKDLVTRGWYPYDAYVVLDSDIGAKRRRQLT